MKAALRLYDCLVVFAGSLLLAVTALGSEQGGGAAEQSSPLPAIIASHGRETGQPGE